MNIALIGYGQMGHEIEKIAIERGHQIVAKITADQKDFNPSDIANADVAIEFTTPKAAVTNIEKCFEAEVPVVVGTTGWYDEFERVVELCSAKEGSLFYATNFSLGVHLFLNATAHLSRLMNPHKSYAPAVHEIHHTKKKDAPSGTAITTTEKMLEQLSDFDEWKLDANDEHRTIPVTADRIEDVPGTHTVTFESDVDKIELTHTAKSRKGFALGSVLAAEFIAGKKGVYTMNDLLKF